MKVKNVVIAVLYAGTAIAEVLARTPAKPTISRDVFVSLTIAGVKVTDKSSAEKALKGWDCKADQGIGRDATWSMWCTKPGASIEVGGYLHNGAISNLTTSIK